MAAYSCKATTVQGVCKSVLGKNRVKTGKMALDFV